MEIRMPMVTTMPRDSGSDFLKPTDLNWHYRWLTLILRPTLSLRRLDSKKNCRWRTQTLTLKSKHFLIQMPMKKLFQVMGWQTR